MGVVVGDEAPHGGVAQVIFHGVRVVEIGLQEDGEGQVEEERGRRESKTTTHVRHADDMR